MTMMSGSTLSPSGGSGPPRSRGTVIALVVVLALVFFAAGAAVTYLLRGNKNAAALPAPAASCVTTSARPGVTLPKPGTVSINVYNATNRSGLARRTATTMTGRGFTVGKVANDPLGKTVTGVAELRHGPTGAQNAALLAYYFPGATLVSDGRTDASVDVVLGAKFTIVPSATAVEVALAKPVQVTSGPGCQSPKPATSPSVSAKHVTSPSASA
ncbi:MAG TPA: LytR C-terminal domain-containing protein [Candidatus Nanopelagicales bacterium]|jgi:hypothetical protein